jgi:hypothetical protein
MYLLPADEPILFGDIFVADWLNDAWLEEDAERLGKFTAQGRFDAYGAHAVTEQSSWLLAHGRLPKAAILLNDDCYIESVLERNRRGRLQLAPVFALPDDPVERAERLNTGAFTRFPLPPAAEFAGGVADLSCTFGIQIKNRNVGARFARQRTLRLDEYGRTLLEARWGAHAARRGPVVARTVAGKLAELLDDSQQADAKKAVERLLARIWSSEGAIPDLIDTGTEDGRPADDILTDVLARAEAIEADAHDAVSLLRAVTAARAN